MTNLDSLWARLSYCVAGILLVIAGCGGGSPGTGGTGVTASSSYPIQSYGSITGFGSIIVNGVRFDDSTAVIHVDGNTGNNWKLGLGMPVSVTGRSTTTVPTEAIAATIDTWSIAQGTVTATSTASITVAGMTITTNPTTVYSGTASTTPIAVGDAIKVWGISNNANYSSWLATRIESATASSKLTSSGVVHVLAGKATLNGFELTSTSAPLLDRQVVTAYGSTTASATSVTVATLHVLDTPPMIAEGTRVEREGVITSVGPGTRFRIGSTEVDASNAVFSPVGSSPALGVRAEAKGSWNGNVLVAQRVELKSQAQLQQVELIGNISNFISTADFVVRGLRCDASQLKFVENGKLSDLKDTVRVHLSGINQGNFIKVTELEIVTSTTNP